MSLKVWFLETRPAFLLLSIALVFLGTSVSFYHGHFNALDFVLSAIGLVLAHASVNVFNDYFDYKSGIDLETKRTAFSGGSGILPAGFMTSKNVYLFAAVSLTIAFFIGVYFVFTSGWMLLPLILIGGLSIYFYTPLLTKWLVGEIFAGLGLGTLPVLGVYFIQTGKYSPEAAFISIIPGLLTFNLLYLNEFPDLEADKKGGRHHIVIALGRKKASILYTAIIIMTYLFVVVGVITKIMPAITLISLVTLPIAYEAAVTTIKYYDNIPKLIPALKFNVITILGIDTLLALSYFIAHIMSV